MTPEQVTCPSCGVETPSRYRMCGRCGQAISEAAPAEILRQATIVTSDLKGSTALGERLDPESLREVMTTYIDAMRAVFEGHGGTIEKIIGDAIVAVFGLPTAGDDDALRAVAAAAESQRALVSLNEMLDQRWGVRLTVRTGVASGDVVVGELGAAQHVLTGPTIAIATAMEQSAPPQEVLLAESTYLAVADSVEAEPMPPITPKGSTLAIPCYRLISVIEREEAAPSQQASEGARLCQTCGEENPEDFAFCGTCGSAMVTAPRVSDTRKTVTVVFADPKPSTADGSAPSPAALGDVMSRYFAGMQAALDRHGATVEKFIGDAVMAVFGLPVRHEDDALRAVRAARDMQRTLPDLNAAFEAEYGITLANHIGVNTGEVVAGDASLGQRLVTGDTVNVAARLEQSAGPREILLGDLTYRLVRDAVSVDEVEPLTLKGKSEPVPAYRLVSVSDATEGFERRQDAPMVGRDKEMQALRELFASATADRACRMATVIGDAGVGKSRLIAEFTGERAEDALVIRGRCLPYGDGITFWPLREAVRDALGIGTDDGVETALAKLHERVPDPDVCDRLASVIGLSDAPFPVPEIFWGARKFLEELGSRIPVLMFIDDIHWAEATFLELITHLTDAVESAPVLLLCSSRHELLERQPDWAQADGSLRLVLSPLTDEDAGLVVEALLGGVELDQTVRGRIVQAAAGNPLFVEQLLSMLIDEGTLQRQGDRWIQVGDLARLRVPPTIQALLAARLDLLNSSERGVIEPASVVGQNFAVAAVTHLVAQPIVPKVPEHLDVLSQKQLVAPNPGVTDQDQAGYRFHHLLVRDAAYGGLLKRARAELHERFVNWAEAFNAEHGVDNRDFEEIHGFHLEQAYRYLSELGTIDDHVLGLGIRASQKLASAGRRAMARGDMQAAANLLRRAAATRSLDEKERLELLLDLGEALLELGEFENAQAALEEARQRASAQGEAALAYRAELIGLMVASYSGEAEGWTQSAESRVQEALAEFTRVADEAGTALAWRLRAGLAAAAARPGDMARATDRVLESARRLGDFRTLSRGASGLAMALVYGPTPAPAAIAQLEPLQAEVASDRRTLALINSQLSQLVAMQGDFDRARELYRGAREALLDLGVQILAASLSLDSARVEMLAGDYATAESELARDHATLSSIGERYLLSTVSGLLARALEAQGRVDEAFDRTMQVESMAAPDDVDAQAIWRGVRSRVLARRGEGDAALVLAKEAVALRRHSDSPMLLAEALTDLAAVQHLVGRADEAAASLTEARTLTLAKEDRTSASRVEALLADVTATGDGAGMSRDPGA